MMAMHQLQPEDCNVAQGQSCKAEFIGSILFHIQSHWMSAYFHHLENGKFTIRLIDSFEGAEIAVPGNNNIRTNFYYRFSFYAHQIFILEGVKSLKQLKRIVEKSIPNIKNIYWVGELVL